VKVKSVTRITHPAYTAGNQFITGMIPWNVDYSRILLCEIAAAGGDPHPVTRPKRILIAGDI